MLSYEGCKGGYAGQYDDGAGFVLEAHPDQPERRCDERQQGQQHERGKQEQPSSSETWCGCSVQRPQFRPVSGVGIALSCAPAKRHLAVAKLVSFGSELQRKFGQRGVPNKKTASANTGGSLRGTAKHSRQAPG
jgi:hypothetical protein